ncbi:MAG: hypothetical protein IIU11_04005 [Bacteroidales bacterium]|jgi:hypothetical protein|nr:hypothetical protein [Bacteroidales bacterium]MBR6278731.1 hypothetical protein [Bacteroidales bacterium]
MQINSDNPIWKKLILGETQVTLRYLAAKIALSHLQLKVRIGKNGYTVEKAALELYQVYKIGENLPAVKIDIQTFLNC